MLSKTTKQQCQKPTRRQSQKQTENATQRNEWTEQPLVSIRIEGQGNAGILRREPVAVQTIRSRGSPVEEEAEGPRQRHQAWSTWTQLLETCNQLGGRPMCRL
jgi:hypothetical protein